MLSYSQTYLGLRSSDLTSAARHLFLAAPLYGIVYGSTTVRRHSVSESRSDNREVLHMNNEQLLQAITDILDQKLNPVYIRLDEVDNRLINVEHKLDEVDGRLINVEHKLDEVDGRLTNVECKLDEVDNRLTNAESKLVEIDDRLTTVDTRLHKNENMLNIMNVKLERYSKKLANFHLDFKVTARDINQNIHALQDEMETVIVVLKLHDLVPQ